MKKIKKFIQLIELELLTLYKKSQNQPFGHSKYQKKVFPTMQRVMDKNAEKGTDYPNLLGLAK